MAADLQYSGLLHDMDGDAAFDVLWNSNMSGEKNGLEYEDDYMIRGGNFILDPCAESSHQPMFSLNTASLRELVNSSHESATAYKDSPSGAVGVGMKYLFMTVQILC